MGDRPEMKEALIGVAIKRPAPAIFKRASLMDRRPALWLELRRGIFGLPTGLKSRVITVLVIAGIELWFASLYFGDFGRLTGRNDFWWFHMIPSGVLLLMAFLTCAATVASAFHRDNAQRSLEVLHAAPLDSGELFRAKIYSVWRMVAPFWMLAVAHLGFGVVMGDMKLVGVVVSIIVASLLLASLTALGALVSLRSKSASKAGLIIFFALVFHLVIWPFFMTLALAGGGGSMSGVLLLIGHHPFFLSALPILLSQEPASGSDIELYLIPTLHLVIYFVFSFVVLGAEGAELYAKRRDKNWDLS